MKEPLHVERPDFIKTSRDLRLTPCGSTLRSYNLSIERNNSEEVKVLSGVRCVCIGQVQGAGHSGVLNTFSLFKGNVFCCVVET